MINASNIKPCANFKSIEKGPVNDFVDMHSVNCKECAYFSSLNCGMDTVLTAAPDMASFT